jgi:hypothetical protein
VRRRRAAKQRIWLGPGGYFCGCERRIAHANAYSDASCKPNAYRDSNAYCDCYCYSNSNPYSYCDTCAQVDADTEAASNAAASPVEFSDAKISSDQPATP